MKRVLTVALAIQLVFQPFATFGDSTQNTSQDSATADSLFYREPLIKDPLIEEMEKANEIPLELGLSFNDPTLDADPFFLVEQHWVPEKQNQKEVEVEDNQEGVSIHVPMAAKTLDLSVPLKLIAISDEYIFLAARNDFRGFDEESQGLEKPGEGVFFIPRADLLNHASTSIPVPIYFLPLPGVGWKEASGAFFEPQNTLVLVDKENDPLPIPSSHLEDVLKAEKMNLLLAQAFSFARNPNSPVDDLRSVIPAPKITAGFGVLFTGIDNTDPEKSLFKIAGLSHPIKEKLYAAVLNFFNNRAEASEKKPFHLDPKVENRIIRVGIVITAALITSVVLKATIFSKYFKEKHKDDPKKGPLHSGKQWILDTGDIFAHALTTFAQIPGVYFANGIEFLGDRYFPELASANNTVIRKFLNKTVYFVRSTNDQVPVSARTWFSGSIILGGIDVYFIKEQMLAAIPSVGREIGDHSHAEWLKERTDNAFGGSNANTESFNINEIARNGAAYLTGGAANLTQDYQAQLDEVVKTRVREEMRRENKNPDDPRNAAQFEARYNKILDVEISALGGPKKEDFLFDANFLYGEALKIMGFTPSQKVVAAGLNPGQVLTSSRPGWTLSSLHGAIAALKTEGQKNPLGLQTPERFEAIKCLESFLRTLNIVNGFAVAPIKSLIDTNKTWDLSYRERIKYYTAGIKEAREDLSWLSYSGNFDNVRSYLPQRLQGYSSQALNLAARTFSDTLNYYANGDGEKDPYAPPKKDRIAQWQERRAIRIATERYLQERGVAFNVATSTEEEGKYFKRLYTSALSNVLGLYPDYSGTPSVEDMVLQRVEQFTETELSQPDVQQYLKSVDSQAKFEFEASIEAANYVKAYIQTVTTEEQFPATSPAQPGAFQRSRQNVSWIRNSQTLTRLTRVAEAFVAGHRIEPGRTAWLDRHIPGWHDVRKTNGRILQVFLTQATATYAFNYLIWGMNLPAHLWVWGKMWAWTIGAPSQLLNRIFRYQGFKPLGKLWAMVLFSIIYTWATCWGVLPSEIFANDFERFFHFVVNEHPAESLVLSTTALTVFNYRKEIAKRTTESTQKILSSLSSAVSNCSRRLGLIRERAFNAAGDD